MGLHGLGWVALGCDVLGWDEMRLNEPVWIDMGWRMVCDKLGWVRASSNGMKWLRCVRIA